MNESASSTDEHFHETVSIPISEEVSLEGDFRLPEDAEGIVLFAHGSGSSRHSPRNQFVAQMLRQAGLGTLLFDLLTSDEEVEDKTTRRLRSDIGLLTARLLTVTQWLKSRPQIAGLRPGYFGANTGGAAALMAAAQLGPHIGAVVSRGGRPDLVRPCLRELRSPTLLIVGENDDVVFSLNKDSFNKIECEKELKIIPRATHLFEEPGKLEEVAQLSARWFQKHLRQSSQVVRQL